MRTRTGNYTIGIRFGGAQRQNNVSSLIEWSNNIGLEVIDFGPDDDQSARKVLATGLCVGLVDLLDWKNMISADKGVRTEAVIRNINYIWRYARIGTLDQFLVMLPDDPSLPKNMFGYVVETSNQLASVLEVNQARLVIEGWPGTGALCCIPEGYRALFRGCGSSAMGIHYDASHLIRMGSVICGFCANLARAYTTFAAKILKSSLNVFKSMAMSKQPGSPTPSVTEAVVGVTAFQAIVSTSGNRDAAIG